MPSIPSTNFGVGADQFAFAFDVGVNKLIDQAGIAEVTNIVDGMLFHNGAVMLPLCQNEKQIMLCHARAQILREFKDLIVERLYPTPMEETDNGDVQ